MNVAIYSQSDYLADFDIEKQVKACQEYVETNGHTVVAAYGDLMEEGNITPPALSWLITASRRKKFEAVLVYSVDRISRNLEEYLMIREQLSRNGVSIISVSEPPDSPPAMRADVRLHYYCEYCKAEHSEKISQGIQMSKEQKAAQRAAMPSVESKNMKGDIN